MRTPLRLILLQLAFLTTTAVFTVATSTMPCGSHSECSAGEVCVGGQCMSPQQEELCGDFVCAAGYECCNASCGTCVPHGQTCDTAQCNPACGSDADCSNGTVCLSGYCHPGERCGDTWCGYGMVCCNALDGICTDPGLSCTQ